MKVLLFARARDLAGCDQLEIPVPDGATVAELRRALTEACPRLGSLASRCTIAVNQEFAGDLTRIPSNAEVALLPPVSGG